LELLGVPQAKDCYHLQYEMVELPDGAMSSRKGNIVPLMTLIEGMETAVTTDHLEKYRGDWSDDEIKATAKDIANGAIKYGMLRMDNNRKIVFDIKEWVKLDGETGPYLQYVYARIRSMEAKCGPLDESKIAWDSMVVSQETALLVHLNSYNKVLMQAAAQLKTIHLCSYLYDLAKLFNSFYNSCPIMRAESEELKHTRLALAGAVRSTMKSGLGLLGIPAPEKM
jgi:arginyl-tRNA synthetase